MALPRLLVHEYVTGGGWPEPEIPAELAAEAGAMLRAVLSDLKAWGQFHTTATVDTRLSQAGLVADRLVVLRPSRHMQTLTRLASGCGTALVIAPETDGVLARITHALEALGVTVLGAHSDAVAIAADKWQCYQLFRECAIPTPETYLVAREDVIIQAAKLNPPWVLKPRCGAGAQFVSLVPNLDALPRAVALACSGSAQCLLQAFVPGVHASVSLLSNGTDAVALSLNEQCMEIGSSFAYRGGRIPLQHPLAPQALALARQCVRLIPGLLGYVGVDLVLTPGECYVLEINPRITTSYVGLRRVIELNLAEAIWLSCCTGQLPASAPLMGSASFAKDGTLG